MTFRNASVRPGRPYPLGATWTGRGVNFALFSAHAEKVELCLFDTKGRKETRRIPLPERTDGVWHGFFRDLGPGQLYGYRVHGPYEPHNGHRFNGNKLLIDPYAKMLVGRMIWHPACFGYRIGHSKEDLSFDKRDSARYVPKCMVVKTDYPWETTTRPEVPLDRSVLYEAHVKGMTMRHPDIRVDLRGTFAGLSSPPVVDHLRDLGVTGIELLPVHAFLDETHLQEKGLSNYWGYNPVSFFAPDNRYLSQPLPDEFKAMVERFHEAGIEVLLDVVYNHTCEGNHFGPTVSLRGIDNKSYYHLVGENPRYYQNHSGCGNALNLSNPRALQMAMDSLRYWAEDMHVDGFRFDLAATLGRGPRGFEHNGVFLAACRQDPVLNRVKLIAEPWDIGPHGYRMGEFPAGWGEWNDAYRDDLRAFWRGDERKMGAMATRMSGSSDIFGLRSPQASVNFITAHDGFTLHDLVSYNDKHNEANQEENKDGTSHNLSWNCGHEGPTEDPGVTALRYQQKRNLVASLMLSQGIPMLLGGDELGRTQGGNNNAYCQDNEISWVDWDLSDPADVAFLDFVRQMIALRRSHPAFRRRRFFGGVPREEDRLKDITWLSPRGGELTAEEWEQPLSRCFGFHVDGAEAGETDSRFIVLMGSQPDPVAFTLPDDAYGGEWTVVTDTARPEDEDDEPPRPYRSGESYPLRGRSLVVLMERAGRPAGARRAGGAEAK
jgi:glycogen operon protein